MENLKKLEELGELNTAYNELAAGFLVCTILQRMSMDRKVGRRWTNGAWNIEH